MLISEYPVCALRLIIPLLRHARRLHWLGLPFETLRDMSRADDYDSDDGTPSEFGSDSGGKKRRLN